MRGLGTFWWAGRGVHRAEMAVQRGREEELTPGRNFCQLGRENLGKSLNQVWGGSSAQVEEEQDALERSVFRSFVDRRSLGLVCGPGREECCTFQVWSCSCEVSKGVTGSLC